MTMVPRYSPTYSAHDLWKARLLSRPQDGVELLRGHLSRLFGTPDVFLFNRARTALFALMRAYGHAGEAILSAYTCVVVPQAVTFAGYRPKFVDVGSNSFNPSSLGMEQAITPRTTAVIVTHQFGIPCDCEEFAQRCRRKGILVIEDAAAALGATCKGKLAGSFGDAAIVSFDKVKVVGSVRGGALIVYDRSLAGRIRHGLSRFARRGRAAAGLAEALLWKTATQRSVYRLWRAAYVSAFGEALYEVVKREKAMPAGYIALMPAFPAALAAVQFERLEENISRRRAIAEIYATELCECPAIVHPFVPQGSACSWIQYPVITNNREGLYRFMQKHGVDVSWTFRYSCAQSFESTPYPNALAAAKTVIGLPTYPSLTDDDALRICRLIKDYAAISRMENTQSRSEEMFVRDVRGGRILNSTCISPRG